MKSAAAVLTITARVLLCAIFLLDAVGEKIPRFADTVERMKGAALPSPEILLVGAIVCLVSGSIAVMLGFKARLGAFLLLSFLGIATFFFHSFWTVADPLAREAQLHEFLKNLSIAGGLLFILANGPGPGSLEKGRG